MLPTTLDAVKSILRADPSLSTPDRARLMALLRKGGPEKPDTAPAAPEPRLLRRAEAARRLGCSIRCIDNWARDKILDKVRMPGRVRAAGFREADIRRLIEGGGAAA